MKISPVRALTLVLTSVSLAACNASVEKPGDEAQKITVTTIKPKTVTLTHQYPCQIRPHHHIMIRSPESGQLGTIQIKEGQEVTQGDLLFRIRPPTDKEKSDAENENGVAYVLAPFNGVVDRLTHPQGTLVQKGEILTTLSDNDQMWAYFNIPEARYLEYKSANFDQHKDQLTIELLLEDGTKFDLPGKFGAFGAAFDFETGNVHFRADFPNPNHLLRNGQSGDVLITHVKNDAVVIPRKATFEVGRYVYMVDKDDVAHRREIVIEDELEDQFVVKMGISIDDRIVIEGVMRVHDGAQLGEHPESKKAVADRK